MPRTPPSRSEQPTGSVALPELKRVILAYGNEVVMKENLAGALGAIFEEVKLPEKTVPEREIPGETVAKTSIQNLAISVLEQYKTAQKHLAQGNWAGYGQALDEMERMLEDLARAGSTAPPER